MSLYTWSQTAANNSNADGTINWAEGQAPSSVNNSARAMMAAAAKFRDDVSGALDATTPSVNTYVVTSNQTFSALTDGLEIAFVPDETNTGTATLNVDSLGAKPLRNVQGTEIGAGVLIANTIYTATYSTTNSGEWIIHSAPSPVLPGSIVLWGTGTAPSGWILLQGQAISRTTYATLFALWSTTYGVGDGSTTFNVPDLVGRIPAGVDSGSSRLSSFTSLGSAIGAESATIAQANLPSVNLSHTLSFSDSFTVTGNESEVIRGGSQYSAASGVDFSGYRSDTQSKFTPTANGSVSGSVTGTISLGGAGTALGITQPTFALHYMAKT